MNDLENIIQDIGDAVRGTSGVDWFDIYATNGVSWRMLFDDGRVDTISSSEAGGVGARAVVGEHTSYAHAPRADASSAAVAMRTAADASGARIAVPDSACRDLLTGDRTTIPVMETDFIHDLDKLVRSECKWVRQATFSYSTSSKSVLIIRGDGSAVRDQRRYTSFGCSIVLERDGESETGSERRAFSVPTDRFWDMPGCGSPTEVALSALRRAIQSLEARPCPAGTMTVLLDGTAGGTMIHEACGHSLEADIILKDFSVFRDKIGEMVASPEVTMIDDPTIPGLYGSYACDDEGVPAGRTVLIENGVLKGYLTDRISAKTGGLPLTGNGRRESYLCAPVPRMSNTFVAPGNSDRDEMLSRVKNGLLVKKMGGGEVDPTSGNFVFFVSEGYLIQGGKVGPAVRGATLTGNGPDTLMKIRAVGRELTMDPGICGKSGQGVPVTDGQPSLLIDDMTVGGKDV